MQVLVGGQHINGNEIGRLLLGCVAWLQPTQVKLGVARVHPGRSVFHIERVGSRAGT